MLDKKVTYISFIVAITVVGLMWSVFFLDYYLELDLYHYGVRPLKTSGLVGVLFSPFIHSTSDFAHIINNSVPTLILTWLLFYHYRTIATKSFVTMFLLSGFSLWLLGRDSYHVGMSGIIYALTAFLVFSGFFRKNKRVAAVSLIVIFLYGSLVWGIFPYEERISWEAHLLGLFSGLITAFIFKYEGPKEPKMMYEVHEELGIEPEGDYWKNPEDRAPQPVNEPKIIVNYTFVPQNIQPIKEEE